MVKNRKVIKYKFFIKLMEESDTQGGKLRMTYESTVKVDFEFLHQNCEPYSEVPTTGLTLYHHRPMKNQGRFGSEY
jgi:hypothetical protein